MGISGALFAPANLLCTPDEIWWSCCCTYSQDFPTGVAENGEVEFDTLADVSSLEGVPRTGHNVSFYEDSLRSGKGHFRKQQLSSNMRCLQAWGMCESYSRTSVTVNSDRLVAIAGGANLFRTIFPDQLKLTGYKSGIWTTSIEKGLQEQPLWRGNDALPALPARRYSAGHPIPSWSPLSFDGK